MTAVLDTAAPAGVFTLSATDAGATEDVARALCAAPGGPVDDPSWVAAARAGWSALPVALRRALHDFRRDSGTGGVLLVRGLPVDEETLPPTPNARGSVQRTASVPAAVLTMIACGLGDPAAFRPEKSGALVQDVVPVPGQETFQGNAGSVLLTWHNENAFHPHRPDFVMLLCLRADHDGIAGLRTAGIRDALPLLSEETRRALAAAEFVTAPPPSFGDAGGDPTPHPVISGDPDDPDLRVDLSATRPLTDRARAALGELSEVFEEIARTAVLAPGDLAIVDNRVTTHGRTAFRPRYDGKDRWLQRTFVLTDLRRSRVLRADDGYVLD
ncbi:MULTISPECIES: clavaminate synthase family protein [Streptomycetaceae]|uniref:Oxygenase (Secreted protein) n=1 Tax=Streptantibioticus cattleyicolor (strain ATCC 35852 / DSM 46488 / JCM 4925 / NBRC 14057 / NRRL 8057) TaxID=1003195 RepID=F8K3D0_STREN|nr:MULTISPECIES: clavaminate synthase family protein [Streptomycetaceae]AEW95044.1 oxygenase (secreted protein) [Streptantibioticus cattleyicolor NRRL 8057 = DSM 46488]MYS59641.1 L-asparagine oxygenase [Streptomyces sp. SID5468]CCB75394.1 L-asparagine oxygenase [Streptantibioticus cattleyicolor NRRL 8057 = DSM 46488]